jgi:large subunit ribosomal protein L4
MALLSKFQDREAVVLDELKLPEIGTGYIASMLSNLEMKGVSCLLGIGKEDIDDKKTIYLSGRNIQGLEVLPATQLNAYGVLRPKRLILTKAALQELCPTLSWKTMAESPPDEEEKSNEDAGSEE